MFPYARKDRNDRYDRCAAIVAIVAIIWKPGLSDPIVTAMVIIRELRQRTNQHDVNRTQVSLPGEFCGCVEIFKTAGDEHESHVLLLFFLFIVLRTI